MTSSTATAAEFVDYYQVLGLQPEWDCETLRKKLLELYGENKSKINAAKGEKLELLNQMQKHWIPQAQKILTKRDTKLKYDQELAEWKRTATPEQKAAAAAIPTLQELWQLIDKGRYLDAIQAGKRLVNHTPDNDKVWEVYGYANYLWHDYQTAIYAAEQAIRCNPQKTEWYADASQYLAAAGRWDEAQARLNQAIQLEPNNTGYRLALANIYMKHEVWSEAEGVLQSVLSTEPSNEAARHLLAIVYNDSAVEALPQIDQLFNAGKVAEGRKLLKQLKKRFEEAQNYAGDDPDLLSLLDANSLLVRRALGHNFFLRFTTLYIDLFLTTIVFYPGAVLSQSVPFLGTLLILAGIFYLWVWLPYKNNGQDLSKRIVGLQIVNQKSDTPVGLIQLIFRAILKPIGYSLTGMYFFLGSIVAIGEIFKFNFSPVVQLFERGRYGVVGLHEMLTGTMICGSAKQDCLNLGKYRWY